ncbi:hypothetical protein IPL85_02190 [Candidatus Saccharibacteria bacterium]|nr:MAG: hypothetical protein IPL85_02190 [Candidatus Saccharibacteria bacterium]
MNPVLIAFIFALGAGTWAYTKLQQRTGYGNSKTALKGAAVTGGIAFVVVLTVALTFL